ncbi:MAG: hypothetical protein E3J47_05900 [Candidatus Stahlbacteria bacterium]|nr:MAG: hypothetical protein E3J47_05900 [Candidatus Stahlbacteria bacterium]
MKVKLYPTKSLSEEYQPTGMYFAFLSVKSEMCHTWIKCRDFLQDAVRNQLTGKEDKIYGFCYLPKEDPKIDLKKTRLLIKGVNLDEVIKYSLQLVNHYEKVAGLTPRSKITKVDDMYIFLGPGEWTQSSVLISLYTLLIRLGCRKIEFKNEKELTKAYEKLINDTKVNNINDIRYLKGVYKYIHATLENRNLLMFKQKDKILFGDTLIGNFHSRSGVVALCSNTIADEKLKDKFKKILGGIT